MVLYEAAVKIYAKTKVELQEAIIPEHHRNIADARNKLLSGVPGWVRPAATPFARQSSCKCHDWKQLLQWAVGYVLHDVLPTRFEQAFFALAGVLQKILDATADIELGEEYSEDKTLEALKEEAVRALMAVEKTVPLTDVGPIVFHIIPHVVDAIYRWNSARNFWAFFTERYEGYECIYIYIYIYMYTYIDVDIMCLYQVHVIDASTSCQCMSTLY